MRDSGLGVRSGLGTGDWDRGVARSQLDDYFAPLDFGSFGVVDDFGVPAAAGSAAVPPEPLTFALVSVAIFWCSSSVGSVLAAHAFRSAFFAVVDACLNSATSLL